MTTPNIEEIVRATIEQLTKQKPTDDDSEYELFVAREDKKKMKRFLKKINKA